MLRLYPKQVLLGTETLHGSVIPVGNSLRTAEVDDEGAESLRIRQPVHSGRSDVDRRKPETPYGFQSTEELAAHQIVDVDIFAMRNRRGSTQRHGRRRR